MANQEALRRAQALQITTNEKILPFVADPKKDLQNERAKGTFDVKALAEVIHGGAKALKRRGELLDIVASDPDFSKENRHFWSQEELQENYIRMAIQIEEKAEKLGINKPMEVQTLRGLVSSPGPIDLNFGMFLPTVNGQGTDEQRAEWLPKIYPNGPVIGTYAQTELGHGTFLRGLETTATYDKASQEFVIHSPTTTSYKWWPGGLGKTVNFVTLMARLFIDGKDYGPHAFLVQLRDFKNHLPLPGVELGDIGPKMGFNPVGNGFLRFEYFRIPRTNMLMRHSQVTPDGRYIKREGSSSKSSYFTMILVRAAIVNGSSNSLAKALTIAIRYSAVRRQTSRKDGELESQVLDFTTQQHQLFTLLSSAYALLFTGQYMIKLYLDFMRSQESGADSGAEASLPEVHATSAGLKALVTTIAANGIEVCRKCCGGHGFSHFSGLPLLYQDYVASCTYEGENTVLALQTARYLLKCTGQAKLGQTLVGNARYLEGAAKRIDGEVFGGHSVQDLHNPEVQLNAFKHVAARILVTVYEKHAAQIKSGVDAEVAWNNNLVDLVRASKAHCFVILMTNFIGAVQQQPAGPVRDVLKTLCDLFALSTITDQLGDFTEDGFVNRQQARLIREEALALLPKIRNNAVSLVDAWSFHDFELQSAIGRNDGDVYNALYEWAQKNPINKRQSVPGYEKYLQPIIHSKL